MVSANLFYTVVFARSARKELSCLDSTTVTRVLQKIEQLTLNPRPVGCKKLRGQNGLWRIRIGNYRVVYAIDDVQQLIDVVIVRHRNDVYKDLG